MYSAEELEELITCSICLDKFTKPKMLPCQHTFCMSCLMSLDKYGDATLKCPDCREVHTVPKGGVANFRDNIMANNLLGLSSMSESRPKEKTGTCHDCEKRSALSLCEHCCQNLCVDCRVSHNRLAAELQESLGTLMFVMSPDHFDKITQNAQHHQDSMETLANERQKIREVFAQHRQDLQDRENLFMSHMDLIEQTYKTIHVNAVTQSTVNSDTMSQKLRQIFDSCTKTGKLFQLNQIVQEIRSIALMALSDKKPDVHFKFQEDQERVNKTIRSYGCITLNDKNTHPQDESSVMDEVLTAMNDLELAENVNESENSPNSPAGAVGGATGGQVAPRDDPTFSFREELANLLLPSPGASPFDQAYAEHSEQNPIGSAILEYLNRMQAANASSTPSTSQQPDSDAFYLRKLDMEPVIIHPIPTPMRVAYCRQDNLLYACDFSHNRIVVCSLDGSNIYPLRNEQTNKVVNIVQPSDIAISDDGLLYIATASRDPKIFIYLRTGVKLGDCPNRVPNVRGIACQGNQLFALGNPSCLYVFERAPLHLTKVIGLKDVKNARYLVCGSDERIYTKDSEVGISSDVAVITHATGRVVERFGQTPTTPSGICVDAEGYVIVGRIGEVDIYKPNRELLCSVKLKTSSSGHVADPRGLCLLPDRRLVVCDITNNRLQIF